MKRVLKQVYCERCKKSSTVAEDVYFCPTCCSVLTEQGHILREEDISILEGSSGAKKTAKKRYHAVLSTIFFLLTLVAFSVAFFMFMTDISNKIYAANGDPSVSDAKGLIYFIAPEHYRLFSLMCVLTSVFFGINMLFDSIEHIRLYPVAAKKINKYTLKVKYYEGFSREKRAEIDRMYHLNKFYMRIRVTAYVKAAIVLILAVLSFYLAFLIYGSFYDNFEYAQNCYLHFAQGDDFDISNLKTIILYGVSMFGISILGGIVNVVFFFRNMAINKEAHLSIENTSLDIEMQTKFKIVLKSAGENIAAVVQAIREISGLILIDAKSIVDSVPVTIKDGLNKTEAEQVLEKLRSAGAVAVME